MFNAYEKAHKAYGWLSTCDVCSVVCLGVDVLRNQGLDPSNSFMDKSIFVHHGIV